MSAYAMVSISSIFFSIPKYLMQRIRPIRLRVSQQLAMGSLGRASPLFNHKDSVGLLNRMKPVRNRNDSDAFAYILESILDHLLALAVQR